MDDNSSFRRRMIEIKLESCKLCRVCVVECVCATHPACRGVEVGAHVAGLERVMRWGASWARRAHVPGSRRALRGVSG
jgi:hypothetical protein